MKVDFSEIGIKIYPENDVERVYLDTFNFRNCEVIVEPMWFDSQSKGQMVGVSIPRPGYGSRRTINVVPPTEEQKKATQEHRNTRYSCSRSGLDLPALAAVRF